ncbi:scavenger receptor class A member 5-like [Acipenser ruthenus]|uniref:scavenger receptor class A member 5-like n=1 Tax=Acipenser ruthenus TaxID=7906 RepID=UPI002740CF73|nr:scavenger receptor class A member 5-like [Acipenser ruthenus]
MAKWMRSSGGTEQITFVENTKDQLDDSKKSLFTDLGKDKNDSAVEIWKKLSSMKIAIIALYVVVLCILAGMIYVTVQLPQYKRSISDMEAGGSASKQIGENSVGEVVWQDDFEDLKNTIKTHSDSLKKLTQSTQTLTEKVTVLEDLLNSSLSVVGGNIQQLNMKSEQLTYIIEQNVNSSIPQIKLYEQNLEDLSNRINILKDDVRGILDTVKSVNSSCMGDIFIHQQDIIQLNMNFENVTMAARRLEEKQINMDANMKQEMDILNNVTEDLRLKDWEHSLALNNITKMQGPAGPKGQKGDTGDRGYNGSPGLTGNYCLQYHYFLIMYYPCYIRNSVCAILSKIALLFRFAWYCGTQRGKGARTPWIHWEPRSCWSKRGERSSWSSWITWIKGAERGTRHSSTSTYRAPSFCTTGKWSYTKPRQSGSAA